MILPEWTARKEAGVSPSPAGSFFVPFRREGRLHMSPDNLFKRRQTGALMGDVNRSAIPPAGIVRRDVQKIPPLVHKAGTVAGPLYSKFIP